MNIENVLMLLVSLLLMVYLVYALLRPETTAGCRFCCSSLSSLP